MRKTVAFVFAVLFAGLMAHTARAGTPDQVLAMFPNTTDDPATLINQNTGKWFPAYQWPTAAQVNQLGALLAALEHNDLVGIANYDTLLHMIVVRLGGVNSNLLFFRGQGNSLEICFFWRVGYIRVPGDPSTYGNPVDPLVFEVPHQGTDGTREPAATFIQDTHARIEYLNHFHPHSAAGTHVKCQSSRRISDGAHCWNTLFNKTEIELYKLYPTAFYVQIHGSAGGELTAYNDFSAFYTNVYQSGPRLLMAAVPDFFGEAVYRQFAFNTPNNNFRYPSSGLNEWVEGHFLNGGAQCSRGASDRGKFVGIEFGPPFRVDPETHNRAHHLALAFNEAMQNWVTESSGLPIGPSSQTGDSPIEP